MALNARQAKFVTEYLVDLNATQAAIRAGYSPKGAEVTGSQLLRNPKVRAEVDAALERRSARVEIKADDVLRELLRLATCDIGDAFDEKGNLKPLHEMSADVRRAIAGVEVTAIGVDAIAHVTKVKFWDKTRGLELLGKHLKLFTEKHEHSVDASLEALILQSRSLK